MKRLMMIFLMMATVLSGAVLMRAKYTAQEKARELKVLAHKIHKDREAIRVLRAEWAYKTTPNKLQNQSMDYLALMPIAPSQILSGIDDIPFRRNPVEPVAGTVGVLLPGVKRKQVVSGSGPKAESVTRTAGKRHGQGNSMLVRLSARGKGKL